VIEKQKFSFLYWYTLLTTLTQNFALLELSCCDQSIKTGTYSFFLISINLVLQFILVLRIRNIQCFVLHKQTNCSRSSSWRSSFCYVNILKDTNVKRPWLRAVFQMVQTSSNLASRTAADQSPQSLLQLHPHHQLRCAVQPDILLLTDMQRHGISHGFQVP